MTSTLPPGGNTHTPFSPPIPGSFRPPQPDEVPARSATLPARLPVVRKVVASLQQVYLALYAAEVGIWEWNVGENTVSWSMFVDKIFGLPPEREHCRCEELFRRIPPDDLARARTVVLQALNSGSAGERFEFQCRVQRLDGERRWIEIAGSVGRSADLCLLGTVQDVTARRRSAENAEDAVPAPTA